MPHTMLRFPTVKARTGLSRSTIYLRISRGTFPAPVSLGDRAVGWIEAEVQGWLTARIAQRRPIAPAERDSSHDPAQEGGVPTKNLIRTVCVTDRAVLGRRTITSVGMADVRSVEVDGRLASFGRSSGRRVSVHGLQAPAIRGCAQAACRW